MAAVFGVIDIIIEEHLNKRVGVRINDILLVYMYVYVHTSLSVEHEIVGLQSERVLRVEHISKSRVD